MFFVLFFLFFYFTLLIYQGPIQSPSHKLFQLSPSDTADPRNLHYVFPSSFFFLPLRLAGSAARFRSDWLVFSAKFLLLKILRSSRSESSSLVIPKPIWRRHFSHVCSNRCTFFFGSATRIPDLWNAPFLAVMEDRDAKRMATRLSDVVLDCVMPYIHDSKDRDAVSQVCRRLYELDSLTRKHVTIALCYTTTPDRLRRRFPHLESLNLKGKPRAAMFNLIPEDWGGFVTPWVREISQYFDCLKSLHFRRMIVRDSDLQVLARSRGHILQALKLDKCSGFSTDGLYYIGRYCRYLFIFGFLTVFFASVLDAYRGNIGWINSVCLVSFFVVVVIPFVLLVWVETFWISRLFPLVIRRVVGGFWICDSFNFFGFCIVFLFVLLTKRKRKGFHEWT